MRRCGAPASGQHKGRSAVWHLRDGAFRSSRIRQCLKAGGVWQRSTGAHHAAFFELQDVFRWSLPNKKAAGLSPAAFL